MSEENRGLARIADTDASAVARRLGRVVFGDRRGVVLFLGSLLALALLTRLGIFITDTRTTANAFVALTEGHLAVETPYYGENLRTPGMEKVDGQFYGRNYGQLVASLPAYLLLWTLSLVTDLQIAIAAAWSLLLLALALQVGRLTDRYEAFAVGGAVVSVLAFFLNAAVATPLDPRLTHVLAMQLTSIVAGALLVVVTYRLLALLRSPRAGVVGGALVLLGTPLGFWAPIPKRHVFTTLLVVTAVYALARSRAEAVGETSQTRAHAAAYAAVGLLAWIHSPEGLLLFVALVVTDLAVLPSLKPRRVGVVGGTFALALVPFFVTNLLINGDPFLSPRFIRRTDVVAVLTPISAAGAGPAQAELGSGMRALALPVVDDAITAVQSFAWLLYDGLVTIRYEPERVYHTLVRSGYVAQSSSTDEQAINLSVAESAPLVAAALAVPGVAARRLRTARVAHLRTPAGTAGLAFAVVSVLLFVVYIDLLPLHAQVTVRYLLPLFAIGVIAVVWLTPVGRALEAHTRTFAWVLAASVLLGGQVLLVVVVQLDLALGEAFQFHALTGLAVAALVVVWTGLGTFTDRFDRLGAAVLGLAVAAVVVFSLFVVTLYTTGIGVYPEGGQQALPVVRLVSELLTSA